MGTTAVFALAALVVIVLLTAYLYWKGHLNKYLPASWQKSTFVGAYGRTAALERTLVTDCSGRKVLFNAGNYA